MTETITTEASRRAMVLDHGLVDLGHLPERVRRVAYFWGGATTGTRALSELAHADGLVGSVDQLRSNILSIHDHEVRDELLTWLGNRVT